MSECKKQDDVNVVEGEIDHEFPHIVTANGKIYCNECGNWEWMSRWQRFMEIHTK